MCYVIVVLKFYVMFDAKLPLRIGYVYPFILLFGGTVLGATSPLNNN